MTRVRLLDSGAFAAYFVLAAYLGRLAVVSGSEVALVWPAAGVAAAWLAVTGWQRWLAAEAACLVVLSWAVYVLTGIPGGVALGPSVGLVVQVLVFGVLISRWCPEWWGFGADPPAGVQRLRDLGLLAVAAVVSAAASAFTGPVWVIGAGAVDWTFLASWVLRNSVGIIAIFPLSLLARNATRSRTPGSAPRAFGPYLGSTVEFVVLGIVTLGVGWLIFVVNDQLPVPFVLLATSVWAGTRFSPWVADLHALLVVGGVTLATVLGHGPFSVIDDPSSEVLVVQGYVAVAVMLTLSLAAGRREGLALHQRLAVSERTATEQAAMMRTILDTMADGVSVLDGAGRLVLRNPAATLLVGDPRLDDDGRVGSGSSGMFYGDGTPMSRDDGLFLRALTGEDVEGVDILVRNPAAPDGRMLEVTSRPIPGSDPPLVVVVFHDVTADRRERDELASFAGVVAHDLLNPLTVVEGWSEALLESARAGIVVPPEKQADQLERIQRAAQRMQHLISDLLAYTTARDLRITPVRVELGAMVRDIARARVEASRVSDAPQPLITVDPNLPDVMAEPVLLRQVIDNLVGNAVKYVAPDVQPEIEVRGHRVEGDGAPMVLIEVLDNGIGIPEDQQSRVFDTFHRAHRDGYRGTGLGLSIVKRISERHGGTASASGRDGRTGTTMRVTFPAVDLD